MQKRLKCKPPRKASNCPESSYLEILQTSSSIAYGGLDVQMSKEAKSRSHSWDTFLSVLNFPFLSAFSREFLLFQGYKVRCSCLTWAATCIIWGVPQEQIGILYICQWSPKHNLFKPILLSLETSTGPFRALQAPMCFCSFLVSCASKFCN